MQVPSILTWPWLSSFLLFPLLALAAAPRQNSTIHNPILPGFHPDPSCIFVKEWDNTVFCASSSFNAFPGIPIHASKDLRNWKLIGHVLNRNEQLPRLSETNRSTSGIWAPALRFHKDIFYVITTLVNDHLPQDDDSRWDNIIFKGKNPYKESSWSVAKHFNFVGYDPSPFWDVDGKSYITAAHAWRVDPGIYQAPANLDTGEVGEFKRIWNGTGGMAPEGPHIYRKDGYYYLMAAEGGTGLDHMETIARSMSISGPFESNPNNPILTNAKTTSYFQTVGHADLFQDANDNWWAVALSTRGGPEYLHFPMVRETVLTAVTWRKNEWPIFTPISGTAEGWNTGPDNKNIPGNGPFISDEDNLTFPPGSTLPAHLTYWRFPIPSSYTISPPGHPNTLRLTPSALNLTALNGNYAGPAGQTFIGRRQQDTLFTFTVDLEFNPTVVDEEAGVSTFLTQNHHLDLGVVNLARKAGTGTLPGDSQTGDPEEIVPHFRFKGESYVPVPKPVVVPVPTLWLGRKLTLEIKAFNSTHYSFSAGPAGAQSLLKIIQYSSNEPLSWGFTGTLLGVYATTNGGKGSAPAYVSNWRYVAQGQFRD